MDSKRNVSSLTDSYTLVIDEAVLKTMENFGYIRDDIQKFLINNELNYATATYFLLSNRNEISYIYILFILKRFILLIIIKNIYKQLNHFSY